jgi:hypothetical protein
MKHAKSHDRHICDRLQHWLHSGSYCLQLWQAQYEAPFFNSNDNWINGNRNFTIISLLIIYFLLLNKFKTSSFVQLLYHGHSQSSRTTHMARMLAFSLQVSSAEPLVNKSCTRSGYSRIQSQDGSSPSLLTGLKCGFFEFYLIGKFELG